MRDLTDRALGTATAAGASYADVRIEQLERQVVSVKNGRPDGLLEAESQGVGVRVLEKTPAREGAELVHRDGAVLGRVTSGGFGPSAGVPIAMAYVQSGFARDGTELQALVRGTPRPAVVSPLPFVPHRYHRGN